MKLTVKEYASKFKISVQAVYQQLNKGTLNSLEENGKKYVLVDSSSIKPFKQEVEQEVVQVLNKQIEKLNKRLRKKDREIERLNKELLNSVKSEKDTLLKYISELNQLRIEHKPEEIIEEEFTEVKTGKKKKKDKKSKKKKK